MNLRKIVGIVSLVVVTGGTIYGYMLYKDIFSANTAFNKEEVAVFIPTGADFEQVKTLVKPYVEDMDRFISTAEKKEYPNNVKAGKFIFTNGMNSNDLIIALRQPRTVDIAFNNQETLQRAVGRIAQQIEPDSLQLLEAFTDKAFLEENGFNEDNVLSIFIPNTYEFFWNTTATKVRDKLMKEYRRFWTPERLAKAEAQGLTPLQVSALAAIVHKETVKNDERPRVAGVYLNRLKKGMKLEADPTVIYAIKKQSGDFDQVIKRVFFKDLVIDSPYNMYKYEGLPPGPIAMPDITAIDAVLNPEQHNYIYFCASVTNFGYHEFAVTPAQHEVNRQKYVVWVEKMGIKR
ncbi:endolytic transglycosylase MltG [Flavobacterium subsaxonicum]|uniref:Endolytic murein transglycosylase n=1 Tax=Flavobacterium subsaxonicum WB 4.1-42 = DSM 21790 TaxID=1121898 RepID=A0A0A2MJM3_9FLAO|nr:endolytic transglycosylase MltG [Flavobacterium subsaxonicum]KGO92842.1 aminodeoxychorismate lyase [Flavobacterium subsaxonicum WB 4.1-42 = DSM 21790]